MSELEAAGCPGGIHIAHLTRLHNQVKHYALRDVRDLGYNRFSADAKRILADARVLVSG